jgi:hypothetical protein
MEDHEGTKSKRYAALKSTRTGQAPKSNLSWTSNSGAIRQSAAGGPGRPEAKSFIVFGSSGSGCCCALAAPTSTAAQGQYQPPARSMGLAIIFGRLPATSSPFSAKHPGTILARLPAARSASLFTAPIKVTLPFPRWYGSLETDGRIIGDAAAAETPGHALLHRDSLCTCKAG